LGELFVKSDCLFRLKQQFENYIKVKPVTSPYLEKIEELLVGNVRSAALIKIVDLLKALELHKRDSDFSLSTIIDNVKEKSLHYLKQKLELERIVATKQRILLLIAEKEQIISKLHKMLAEKDGRNLGDLKEKELVSLLKSVHDYRQKVKLEKQSLDKQLLTLNDITDEDRQVFCQTEQNDLFKQYLKSEDVLESYREKCSQYKGLPADVRLAKIRVAQAQEALIKKIEKLNKILEKC
jgi:hypothetical protein